MYVSIYQKQFACVKNSGKILDRFESHVVQSVPLSCLLPTKPEIYTLNFKPVLKITKII